MNPKEQRAHTKTTDELAHAVLGISEASAERFHLAETALTTLTDTLEAQQRQIDGLQRQVDHEHDVRLKETRDQRSYVDGQDRLMQTVFYAHRDRTRWERLRWLVTGR